MVIDLIAKVVEPEPRDLGEDDAFARQTVGHNDVERADPVRSDNQQRFLAVIQRDVVKVANLARAAVRQIEIGFQ